MLRLIRLFAFAFIAASAAPAAFGQAGYVHDLSGTATIQAKSGKPVPLKVGDVVNPGQTITTADKSSAVVKFADGQIMALHETTSFAVDAYRFDVKTPASGNAAFSLIKGGLRFISGVIGSTSRSSFKISAANATIGIRGTDATLILNLATQAVTAAVNAGVIDYSTPLGSQTVNQGNFTTSSPGSPPSPPANVANAPAFTAAVINVLKQKAVPNNTPVAVTASANAVRAQVAANQAQAAAKANPTAANVEAEKKAVAAAADALKIAVDTAVTVLNTAIANGAVLPAPPADTLPTQPTAAQAAQVQQILTAPTPPREPIVTPNTCGAFGASPC